MLRCPNDDNTGMEYVAAFLSSSERSPLQFGKSVFRSRESRLRRGERSQLSIHGLLQVSISLYHSELRSASFLTCEQKYKLKR